MIGAGGGRLDHLVAGLLLLGLERYAALEIDAVLGDARAHVIRGERALTGTPGELISLLALHGPATAVVTTGLAYPLSGETLVPGRAAGSRTCSPSPRRPSPSERASSWPCVRRPSERSTK